MNLKYMLAFLFWYLILGGIFIFGNPYLSDATNSATIVQQTNLNQFENASVNSTGYISGSSDLDLNIFNVINKFISAAGFIFFGIGLPSDTPVWFVAMFFIVSTGISILALLVVIDAIHGG